MKIVIATVPNQTNGWDWKFIMVDGWLTHHVSSESVHYADGYIDALNLFKGVDLSEVTIEGFDMNPPGIDEDHILRYLRDKVNSQLDKM
jgi:hypothetical protein